MSFVRLVVVHLLLLVALGCGNDGGSGEADRVAAAQAPLDAEALELEAYVKRGLAASLPPVTTAAPDVSDRLDPQSGVPLVSVLASTPAPPEAPRASTTNLQEAGVDEADRVKFGGGHLYVAQPPDSWRGWEIRPGLNSPTLESVGALVVARPEEPYGANSTNGDRSVIQGDAVHYVHGEEVWSAPWDDPADSTGPQ